MQVEALRRRSWIVMTERINGQGFRPTETAGARRTDGAKPASGGTARDAESAAPPAGDTVNLTRSALLLAKLEEVIRGQPAVDADHVRAVKDALASGSYEVDDQAVADSMIRMDRELLA
jgi:negative regulator of flagellin synthesis FlgM